MYELISGYYVWTRKMKNEKMKKKIINGFINAQANNNFLGITQHYTPKK